MSADEKTERLEGMVGSLLQEMRKPKTPAFGLRQAEVDLLLELPGQVKELTSIAKEARDTAAQTKKILVGNGEVGLVAEVENLKGAAKDNKKLPTEVDRLKQDAERARWFTRLVAGGTVGALLAIAAKWMVG
jgi:hypothetical protein